MMNNSVFSIGVMSGTSLDGIDLVYVKFETNDPANFKIVHAETVPYTNEWKVLLQNAITYTRNELIVLHKQYGRFLGKIIADFKNNYNIQNVDFIASHGHTILHEPDKGITLQVGCGEEIAKKTNIKVVYDFRTQDVKLGGQGAPLVPVGDQILFKKYDFCLNLGGFSNVSYALNNQRIAFDICPVNIVLNHYANQLDLPYDASGKCAAKGRVNEVLLTELNALDFYKKEAPKSLGLEWVQAHIFPVIDAYEKNVFVVLSTFVEHIAIQIGANQRVEPTHNRPQL